MVMEIPKRRTLVAPKLKVKAKRKPVKARKCAAKVPPSERIRNPASVTVGGSLTRNIGGMEFVKVQLSLTRPSLDTGSDIERVYQECSAWIDEKFAEEMKKI